MNAPPLHLLVAIVTAAATAWAASAAPLVEVTPQTPFEKECQGIALLLERDLNADDGSVVERYFDTDACVERALAGLSAPARIVEDFRRGAPGGFFKTFTSGLVEANAVRLVRLHRVDKELRILVRVQPKQGGVDYLDLVFEKTRRGTSVVDAEVYSQGQPLSYAVRCQFLPLSRDPNRSFFDDLPTADRELVEQLPQIKRLAELNGSGRYSEVLGYYARLPASVQKSKPALLQRLTAAAQVDQRGLAAALDLWRAAYPGEISIEFIAANLHHAKRNYEPAYAALDRFEQELGGDPYLDLVRAQWEKNQGHLDMASPFARKAVTRNPKMHEGWELLINLGLATRNYAEVAQVLNEWEKATQVDVLRLAESEKLAYFARSPEGRQWLTARDSRRGPAVTNATPSTAKVNHRLQGIFYTVSNPSAIISGRTVFTGDRLIGGFRVERISPKSVILQSPDGESVELALK